MEDATESFTMTHTGSVLAQDVQYNYQTINVTDAGNDTIHFAQGSDGALEFDHSGLDSFTNQYTMTQGVLSTHTVLSNDQSISGTSSFTIQQTGTAASNGTVTGASQTASNWNTWNARVWDLSKLSYVVDQNAGMAFSWNTTPGGVVQPTINDASLVPGEIMSLAVLNASVSNVQPAKDGLGPLQNA